MIKNYLLFNASVIIGLSALITSADFNKINRPPLVLHPEASAEAKQQELYQVDKKKLLDLVNQARGSGRYCGSSYEKSALPLIWNSKLERAAQLHAHDMLRKNYFDHFSKDGSPFYIRIKRQSYDYIRCAENIAMGYKSEEAVIEGWIKSQGHCLNLINPVYSEVAVARAGNYWVMVLGRPYLKE